MMSDHVCLFMTLAFQALEGFFAEHERLPYAKRVLLWEARMERLWQRYASIYWTDMKPRLLGG